MSDDKISHSGWGRGVRMLLKSAPIQVESSVFCKKIQNAHARFSLFVDVITLRDVLCAYVALMRLCYEQFSIISYVN